MMDKLKVLLRLKGLREEQTFRRVTAKRREVLDAEAVLHAARRAMRESEATLPTREDGVFQPILRRVVGFDDVDRAKANLQALQKEHGKFVDSAERAGHVEKRLQKQLVEAIKVHQQAIRQRDKYTTLTDEAATEHRQQFDYRDEVEVENQLIGKYRKSHD